MNIDSIPPAIPSSLRPGRVVPRPGIPAPHRPGLPRTPLVTHTFTSIEALQRALVRPNFEAFLLRPAPFRTTIVRAVPRPGLGASLGTSEAAIRSRGELDPDAVDVVVVVDAPGRGFFNGIPLKAGSVVVLPGGIEFEGHAPQGFRWANLHLSSDDLRRATRALTGRAIDLPTREALVRPTLPADTAALSALHEAGGGTGGAPSSETGEVTAESVVETWLGIAARALAGPGSTDLAGARTPGDRHRVFLAAEAHMRAHLAEAVYTADLCQVSGVSERTLEYAFHEQLGLTPIAYLTKLRLNMARLSLVDAAAEGDAAVGPIARGLGFQHLGRFAARYREQFGESPSETVRRHRPAGAASSPGAR